MHKNFSKCVGVAVVLSAFAVGCAKQTAQEDDQNLQSGIDESIIDRAINPCDDFYQFACGKWLQTAQIPADLPMWNRSFTDIAERNKIILRDILADYAKGNSSLPNPYAQKLGDFYGACMDEKRVEKDSIPDLKNELKKIDALKSTKELPALIASLQVQGADEFFGFGDDQDAKNSSEVIGEVDQGGLGLPDRDYYLKKDPKMAEIRGLYKKHIEKIFTLLGESPAEAQNYVKSVMTIETELAKFSQSKVDRRDPEKVYHRIERVGLQKASPDFNWDEYFSGIGMPELQTINVTYPEFFTGMDHLIQTTKLADLKRYMKWHLVDHAGPALPKRFVNENFQFSSKALTGQKELPVRWKRCVRVIDGGMGFALGRAYVEKTYGEAGKARTVALIQNIEDTFGEGLRSIDWMDDTTRTEALKKLEKIGNKVGYPDKWRNYDSLKVDRDSYLRTLFSADSFNFRYHADKIGKPLDRTEWDMSPPTVNAYYNPAMNEMVFPAGILQSPFFRTDARSSANYGGIGMVMGHELTHGFDDQGRRFDAGGNLRDWWTEKASKEFDERAACVAKQYDGYEGLPGIFVNGKLTLGENIADQGGIKFSYRAWKKIHVGNSQGASPYTDDQQFFIAFAQAWCTKIQEPFARMLLATNPHSPAKFRVNGPLSSSRDFAKTFSCTDKNKMVPANRCEIW